MSQLQFLMAYVVPIPLSFIVLLISVGSCNSLWKYSKGILVVSITYCKVLLHLILATETIPCSFTILEMGFVCQKGVKTITPSVTKKTSTTDQVKVCFLIFIPKRYTSKLFLGQSSTHSIQLIQSG